MDRYDILLNKTPSNAKSNFLDIIDLHKDTISKQLLFKPAALPANEYFNFLVESRINGFWILDGVEFNIRNIIY